MELPALVLAVRVVSAAVIASTGMEYEAAKIICGPFRNGDHLSRRGVSQTGIRATDVHLSICTASALEAGQRPFPPGTAEHGVMKEARYFGGRRQGIFCQVGVILKTTCVKLMKNFGGVGE